MTTRGRSRCCAGWWMAARVRSRRGGRICRCGSSRSAGSVWLARLRRGGCCWRVVSGWRAGVATQRAGAVMSGGSWPVLSALDARVLRATDARYERSPERIGELAGCAADVALSALRRLRVRAPVEDDGERPQRWLRTHRGDVALEHAA